MEPVCVATTKLRKFLFTIPFEEVYPMKREITSLGFIWETNSYLVDVENQFFVINGGRKLRFDETIVSNPLVLCVKHHEIQIGMAGKEEQYHEISFYLGYEGERAGEKKTIFLHVSPDGKMFKFQNKR